MVGMMFSNSSGLRSGGSPVSDARSDVVGGIGQVGYECLDLFEGVLFGFGFVVHLSTVVDVHLVAAEFFLVQHLAYRATHDGRAGREYLGLSLYHHGEVGHEREGGGRARDRPHYAGGDRNAAQKLDVAPPEVSAPAGPCARRPRRTWSCVPLPRRVGCRVCRTGWRGVG